MMRQGQAPIRQGSDELCHLQAVVRGPTDQHPGPGEPEQVLDFASPGPRADAHRDDAGFFAAHQGDVNPRAVGEQEGDALAPGHAELFGQAMGDAIRSGIVAAPGQGGCCTQVSVLSGLLASQLGDALAKGLGHGDSSGAGRVIASQRLAHPA